MGNITLGKKLQALPLGSAPGWGLTVSLSQLHRGLFSSVGAARRWGYRATVRRKRGEKIHLPGSLKRRVLLWALSVFQANSQCLNSKLLTWTQHELMNSTLLTTTPLCLVVLTKWLGAKVLESNCIPIPAAHPAGLLSFSKLLSPFCNITHSPHLKPQENPDAPVTRVVVRLAYKRLY